MEIPSCRCSSGDLENSPLHIESIEPTSTKKDQIVEEKQQSLILPYTIWLNDGNLWYVPLVLGLSCCLSLGEAFTLLSFHIPKHCNNFPRGEKKLSRTSKSVLLVPTIHQSVYPYRHSLVWTWLGWFCPHDCRVLTTKKSLLCFSQWDAKD